MLTEALESLITDAQKQIETLVKNIQEAQLDLAKLEARFDLFGRSDLSDKEQMRLKQLPDYIYHLGQQQSELDGRLRRLQSALSTAKTLSGEDGG